MSGLSVALRNVAHLVRVSLRHPVQTLAVFRFPRIAWLGFVEGSGDMGLTFGDVRDEVYDFGRAVRRIGWDES